MSLNLVRDSFSICQGLIDLDCYNLDNIFDVDSFTEKIVC